VGPDLGRVRRASKGAERIGHSDHHINLRPSVHYKGAVVRTRSGDRRDVDGFLVDIHGMDARA